MSAKAEDDVPRPKIINKYHAFPYTMFCLLNGKKSTFKAREKTEALGSFDMIVTSGMVLT